MKFALRMSEAGQRNAGRAAKTADLMFTFNATTNGCPNKTGQAPSLSLGFPGFSTIDRQPAPFCRGRFVFRMRITEPAPTRISRNVVSEGAHERPALLGDRPKASPHVMETDQESRGKASPLAEANTRTTPARLVILCGRDRA